MEFIHWLFGYNSADTGQSEPVQIPQPMEFSVGEEDGVFTTVTSKRSKRIRKHRRKKASMRKQPERITSEEMQYIFTDHPCEDKKQAHVQQFNNDKNTINEQASNTVE